MTIQKNSPGKKLSLDWKKIDMYLNAGCTGSQIAAHLGINQMTLYRHCESKYKKKWSDYSMEKRSSGHLLILWKQFAKAMSGDNSMLIWVGKQQLGQRDEVKTNVAFDGKLGSLLDNLKNVGSEKDFKEKEKTE